MATSTRASVLLCGEDLVAEAGVLHFEGNHFAESETQYRDCLAGARGQGIEVENEDANRGVGNDDGDEAAARRDAGQCVANGERNSLGRAHVQFADAGHEHAWAQRFEGVDRRLILAGKRRGEHALGRELDGRGRTASVLRGRIRSAEDGTHYRDASMKVTLLISLSVVNPRRTRSRADSRRKLMPSR